MDLIVNIFRGVEEQVPVRRKLQVETYQQAITSLIRSGFDTGSMYGLQGEILDYQGSITLTEVNYIIPVECKSSIRLVKGDQTQIVRYSPDNTLQDLCNLAIAYDFGTSIGLVLALEPLQSYSTKLAEIPFFSVITPAEIPHLEITDITIPRNIKFGEMFHPPVRRLDFDGDGDNDFNPCFEEIYPKHGLNCDLEDIYPRLKLMYPGRVLNRDFDGDEDNDFNPRFEDIYPKHGYINDLLGIDWNELNGLNPRPEHTDPLDGLFNYPLIVHLPDVMIPVGKRGDHQGRAVGWIHDPLLPTYSEGGLHRVGPTEILPEILRLAMIEYFILGKRSDYQGRAVEYNGDQHYGMIPLPPSWRMWQPHQMHGRIIRTTPDEPTPVPKSERRATRRVQRQVQHQARRHQQLKRPCLPRNRPQINRCIQQGRRSN